MVEGSALCSVQAYVPNKPPEFLFSLSYRVFIPSYISSVKVQLVDCSTRNRSSESCPVLLKLRARAPPVHNSSAVDCRENMPCELEVPLLSWEQWYYILVERYLSIADVYFRIGVQVKGKNLKNFVSECFWSYGMYSRRSHETNLHLFMRI